MLHMIQVLFGQTLRGKRWSVAMDREFRRGVYNGREDGVMGSLAARRVAEGDRAGVWEAVIVDLFPGVAIRWDSSSSSASLAVGADAFGTRGDIERHCGPSIGPLDGWVAGPLTLDGEPGNQPEWRL